MRRVPAAASGAGPSNARPEARASRGRSVDPGGPAGSSSATIPSSQATRTQTAVASFVTEAHGKTRPASPHVACTLPSTRTATCAHGHPPTCRSARTCSTLPVVDRQLVSSGAAFEARVGFGIIARALAEAGAGLDDVVRTRIYLVDASDIDEVGRAHAEAFARARPATTGIVTTLLDPRWRVEIEAEAVIGGR